MEDIKPTLRQDTVDSIHDVRMCKGLHFPAPITKLTRKDRDQYQVGSAAPIPIDDYAD